MLNDLKRENDWITLPRSLRKLRDKWIVHVSPRKTFASQDLGKLSRPAAVIEYRQIFASAEHPGDQLRVIGWAQLNILMISLYVARVVDPVTEIIRREIVECGREHKTAGGTTVVIDRNAAERPGFVSGVLTASREIHDADQ